MANAASEHHLYNNLPKHDFLGVLDQSKPKEVVNFLHFTREEVSKATNVPVKSIRYDKRIPEALRLCLREIAVICELVAEHFNGDKQKTSLWFEMKNPALGDISPRDMIRLGRYKKLEKFIRNSKEGNTP